MDYLKMFRRQKKITQKEMAKILEYSYSHYVKVENGFTNPSYDFLLKIKNIYVDFDLNKLIKK
ncbi:helix-turn-helix domain-containing protein [Carnobacterium gallinarum]|uniref:helix-turn-helix domain-containing protein n=1 Tax=Carnobacterium gallinarum TaxID=2749 RepID=UPI0005559E60|nr:helix-turn-helix transcriptional regulator [Carnobacterium gallinarum]